MSATTPWPSAANAAEQAADYIAVGDFTNAATQTQRAISANSSGQDTLSAAGEDLGVDFSPLTKSNGGGD